MQQNWSTSATVSWVDAVSFSLHRRNTSSMTVLCYSFRCYKAVTKASRAISIPIWYEKGHYKMAEAQTRWAILSGLSLGDALLFFLFFQELILKVCSCWMFLPCREGSCKAGSWQYFSGYLGLFEVFRDFGQQSTCRGMEAFQNERYYVRIFGFLPATQAWKILPSTPRLLKGNEAPIFLSLQKCRKDCGYQV